MSQNSYIKEIIEGQTFEELKKSLEGRVKELEEACRINAPKEYKQGLEKDINYLSKQLEKKAKEQVQLQDRPLKDEQKTKSKEENKLIIGDMQSELEYFQKRLATEPLESPKAEPKQDYPDKRLIDAMAEDEIEKECLQTERNSLFNKLKQLRKDYYQTGSVNKGGMKEFEQSVEENRSEGRLYDDIEYSYIQFKKEVQRASSKYG